MLIDLRVPFSFIKKDFLSEASYKLHFLMQLAGILISSLTFFFLSKLFDHNMNTHLKPYGGDYFSFVLIGFAFSNYLQVSLQGFGATIRESQLTGVMEMLLITETRLTTIIISSSLYRFILTSVHILLFLILGVTVFGMNISNANYLAAFIILVLTISSSSCLGILSASFVVIFKKGDPISWLFSSLSWLIGGVYYPISILPEWLQNLSYMVPTRYSLEGMRLALLQGYSIQELLSNIAGLVFFTVIMLPLSLVIFQYAVKKAKVDGTLTQY